MWLIMHTTLYIQPLFPSHAGMWNVRHSYFTLKQTSIVLLVYLLWPSPWMNYTHTASRAEVNKPWREKWSYSENWSGIFGGVPYLILVPNFMELCPCVLKIACQWRRRDRCTDGWITHPKHNASRQFWGVQGARKKSPTLPGDLNENCHPYLMWHLEELQSSVPKHRRSCTHMDHQRSSLRGRLLAHWRPISPDFLAYCYLDIDFCSSTMIAPPTVK